MFTQFFGMKFNPFSKEIDAGQMYLSRDLQELESRLKYLQTTRGIGLVVGEAGSGKSTALRRYVTTLSPSLYKYLYFALSTVTVLDFYYGLALGMGEEPSHRKVAMFNQIQHAILALYTDRRITPVIVLDEIHLAANRLLEDLRLMFNFHMDSQNPFILILAGQPFIRSKLALNVNNPLKQRLTVKYNLRGLEKDELRDYCQSRLKLAGVHEEVFTPPALEAIHSLSNGLPRLVNSLATACLLYACAKRERQVDEEAVYHAQNELEL